MGNNNTPAQQQLLPCPHHARAEAHTLRDVTVRANAAVRHDGLVCDARAPFQSRELPPTLYAQKMNIHGHHTYTQTYTRTHTHTYTHNRAKAPTHACRHNDQETYTLAHTHNCVRMHEPAHRAKPCLEPRDAHLARSHAHLRISPTSTSHARSDNSARRALHARRYSHPRRPHAQQRAPSSRRPPTFPGQSPPPALPHCRQSRTHRGAARIHRFPPTPHAAYRSAAATRTFFLM